LGDDGVGRVVLSSRIIKNCFYNNGQDKGLAGGEKGEKEGKPAGFITGGGGGVGSGKKVKPVSGKRVCSKLANEFINNKLRSGNRFGEGVKDGCKTDRTCGQRDTAQSGKDNTTWLEKSKESKLLFFGFLMLTRRHSFPKDFF
jgi:hypothetical protein